MVWVISFRLLSQSGGIIVDCLTDRKEFVRGSERSGFVRRKSGVEGRFIWGNCREGRIHVKEPDRSGLAVSPSL